jgi:hypothetical protein
VIQAWQNLHEISLHRLWQYTVQFDLQNIDWFIFIWIPDDYLGNSSPIAENENLKPTPKAWCDKQLGLLQHCNWRKLPARKTGPIAVNYWAPYSYLLYGIRSYLASLNRSPDLPLSPLLKPVWPPCICTNNHKAYKFKTRNILHGRVSQGLEWQWKMQKCMINLTSSALPSELVRHWKIPT